MIGRIAVPTAVVALIASMALAVMPWAEVYVAAPGGTRPVALLWASVTISVLIPVVVGGVGRRRFSWSLLASAVTYAVVVLAVAVKPAFSLAAVADGYGSALSRLLSSTPPLIVDAGTLVPAVTAGWVAGAIAGELLVRTRRIGALLLPPVTLLVLSLAVTAREVFESGRGGPVAQVAFGLALFVSLCVLVVFRHIAVEVGSRDRLSRSERRKMAEAPAFAVALVLGALLLVVLATDSVPGLRTSQEVASLGLEPQLDTPSPSSAVRVLRNLREDATTGNNPVLFQAEVNGPSPRFFPVATFDSYNGAFWSFERRFTPTGFTVSGSDECEASVVQQYEVVSPIEESPNLMVALGDVVCALPIDLGDSGATGDGQVLYDADSKMLWSPQPLAAGTTYEVRSEAIVDVLEDLDPEDVNLRSSQAGFPPRALEASLLRLGPDRDLASKVATTWLNEVFPAPAGDGDPSGAGSFEPAQTVEPLIEVVQWMRSNFSLADPDGLDDGVSVALTVLDQQLREGGRAGDGTIEQLATLYALIAVELGVDARLVTGFRVDEQAVSETAGETIDLRAGDAWTWAEVFVGDRGWVVVDLDPDVQPDNRAEEPPVVDGSEDPPQQQPNQQISVQPELLDEDGLAASGIPWRVLGVGALVMGALGWLFSRRARRRARRRRGNPLQASLGAWHETLDVLEEARLGDVDSATANEVVRASVARFGPQTAGSVAGVAVIADPAVFSEREMTADQAAAAWSAADQTRRELARRLSWRQRAGALMRASVRRRSHYGDLP